MIMNGEFNSIQTCGKTTFTYTGVSVHAPRDDATRVIFPAGTSLLSRTTDKRVV
jgi:hypothetical protein